MKLIECYIENFGKISKQKFEFSKGLNCFLSDNGTGKTTLSVFIKAMLYGIGDTKKTSLSENERKHYMPWQGGSFGGWLSFSKGGKEYRVERSFAPKAADDTFSLYELKTGLISSDFSERLGEEIFGIDADGFERTVFLSERALSVKSDNKSISAKLSDLVGADGDIGVMDGAIKILEDQRKFLYKKGGSGRIADIKAKLSETELKLSETEIAKKSRDEAESEITGYKEELAAVSAEHKRLLSERTAAQMRVAEEKHTQRYKQLKIELAESMHKKDELTEFFGGEIPTHEQLEEARYKSLRASQLMKADGISSEEEEYSRLASYFAGRADDSRISEVRAAYELVRKKEERAASPTALRARELFKKRVPSKSEIDSLICEISAPVKRNGSIKALYIILSAIALLSLIPAILFSPTFYVITAIAAISFTGILSVDAIKIKKERGAADIRLENFFLSVMEKVPKSEEWLSYLIEMKSLLDVAAEFLEDCTTEDRLLDQFIEAFSDEKCYDKFAFLDGIFRKYERYIALSQSVKYKTAGRLEASAEAERLRNESLKFLSRFPTTVEDPFDEIRRALSEYTRLTENIISRRKELTSYETLHSADIDVVREGRSIEDIDLSLARTEAMQNELMHKAFKARALPTRMHYLIERKSLLFKKRS